MVPCLAPNVNDIPTIGYRDRRPRSGQFGCSCSHGFDSDCKINEFNVAAK